MVSMSAEVADVSHKYTTTTTQQASTPPQQQHSSTTVTCPNNKKYKTTNCECPFDANNTYTNVIININDDATLTPPPPPPTTTQVNTCDESLKNTHADAADVELKPAVCVAFNFYGKCGICSYFVKQNVVLLGNKQATLDTNDYFASLIKADIKGIQFCSDTPFDILTLRERLSKLNNVTSSQQQRHQTMLVRNDVNEDKPSDTSCVSHSTDEIIVKTNDKGFSTMTIIPVTNGDCTSMKVNEINYVSTSDLFEADNGTAGETITAGNMSQIIKLIDDVEHANTIHISQDAINTSQDAIDISQDAIDTCEETMICVNSMLPVDNGILSSPRTQAHYECDNQDIKKRKHSVDCEDQICEQSNVTENERIHDDQHTLRHPWIDEEKYILVNEYTNSTSTESFVSTSNDENDCLLTKDNKVIGSINELSVNPMIEVSDYRNHDNTPHRIQRSRTPSIDSTGDHCRVCHCRGDEVLIAPCLCNGSLKYVHETCLITWMKNPFKDACEICKKKILIVKKRKPIYTWRWPLQRPTPLVWVIVFTTAICVNLMSVVKDATRKCVSTSCIIFYVIGSVGIILASMFLYFWVKRVKVFCESWKVQNEHWVVKIEDEPGKIV